MEVVDVVTDADDDAGDTDGVSSTAYWPDVWRVRPLRRTSAVAVDGTDDGGAGAGAGGYTGDAGGDGNDVTDRTSSLHTDDADDVDWSVGQDADDTDEVASSSSLSSMIGASNTQSDEHWVRSD